MFLSKFDWTKIYCYSLAKKSKTNNSVHFYVTDYRSLTETFKKLVKIIQIPTTSVKTVD